MKEYKSFEDRETDWLSQQKRSEKEILDLNEAKTIKDNHEQIHKASSSTALLPVRYKEPEKKQLTLIEVLILIFGLLPFIIPLFRFVFWLF